MAMTERKGRFAMEYCVDENATQAAIRAGYSEDTAHSQGSRLLKDVEVSALIAKQKAAIAHTAGLSQQLIVRELMRIAFGDITDVTVWESADGSPTMPGTPMASPVIKMVPTSHLSPSVRAAIAEVSETKTGIKVKMHDKTKALSMLEKYVGVEPTMGINLNNPDGKLQPKGLADFYAMLPVK